MQNGIQDLWLWIDASAECNLACRLCYTRKMQLQSHLKPGTLRAILAMLRPHAAAIRALHMNWRGEPLLNAAFPELLSIVGAELQCTPVQWHTNGTLLNAALAEQLVNAHQNQSIYVSLDGGGKRPLRNVVNGSPRILLVFGRHTDVLREGPTGGIMQPSPKNFAPVKARPADLRKSRRGRARGSAILSRTLNAKSLWANESTEELV